MFEQVLNEVVIHRGIYSGVCMVDIYCDDFFVTTVIGDGGYFIVKMRNASFLALFVATASRDDFYVMLGG